MRNCYLVSIRRRCIEAEVSHAKVRFLRFFVGSLFFVFSGGVVLAINNSLRGRPWRPVREHSPPAAADSGYEHARRTAPCQSLIQDRRATFPSQRPLAAPPTLKTPRSLQDQTISYLIYLVIQNTANRQPNYSTLSIPHSANFTSFLLHFYPLPCLIAGAWLLFMESQFLASPHSSPNPSGSTPLVSRESSGQQDDVSSREFRCTADLCGDLLSGWTRRLHNA